MVILTNTNSIDDDEIVLHLLYKDDNGHQLLSDKYLNFIIIILKKSFRIQLTNEDCEEIASSTLSKVINKIETFDSKLGSFKSWIFKIAKNLAIDRIRKTTRDLERQQNFQLQEKFLEKELNRLKNDNKPVSEELLIAALNSLPYDQKEVVMAFIQAEYEYGLTKLLAQQLGLSINNIRVLKHRGKIALINYLERGVK